MSLCPCGSGLELDLCCQPILDGQTLAPTAEALMRARYVAHTLGNFKFLTESTHPEFRDEVSSEEIEEWSSMMKWERLEILDIKEGGHEDETGEVGFVAHYSVKGVPQEMREDAFFRKENDHWYYVEGTVYGKEPVRRVQPKIGRNDPCPCGSGKKYKKCCLGAEN